MTNPLTGSKAGMSGRPNPEPNKIPEKRPGEHRPPQPIEPGGHEANC